MFFLPLFLFPRFDSFETCTTIWGSKGRAGEEEGVSLYCLLFLSLSIIFLFLLHIIFFPLWTPLFSFCLLFLFSTFSCFDWQLLSFPALVPLGLCHFKVFCFHRQRKQTFNIVIFSDWHDVSLKLRACLFAYTEICVWVPHA